MFERQAWYLVCGLKLHSFSQSLAGILEVSQSHRYGISLVAFVQKINFGSSFILILGLLALATQWVGWLL